MKKMAMIAVLVVSLSAAGLTFAFDNVNPADAFSMASADSTVYILDVRTQAEWQWVGHPGQNKAGEGAALNGKVVNISYLIEHKGAMIVNPSFLSDVAQIFGAGSGVTLITMCRSGHRSSLAATDLEAAGYRVLNMVTGFEGGTDGNGYRTVNGWRNVGLPYSFSGTGYSD